MARADLETIIAKYKQLFAVYYDEEQSSVVAPTQNQRPVDGYVEPDRFVREPIQPVEQGESIKEGQFVIGSLFAGVDQDEYLDPMSYINQREVVEENALRLDILAAAIAWKFAEHNNSLSQMYDPRVGMYPTQALFTPPKRLFRWGGGVKERRVIVRPELDPKKGKGSPKVGEMDKRRLMSKSIKHLKRKKRGEEEAFYEENERQRKRKKRYPFFRPFSKDEED